MYCGLYIGEYTVRGLSANKGRLGLGRLCPVCHRHVAVLLAPTSVVMVGESLPLARQCPAGMLVHRLSCRVVRRLLPPVVWPPAQPEIGECWVEEVAHNTHTNTHVTYPTIQYHVPCVVISN